MEGVREGEGEAGGYEDLGHGESIKMELAKEDKGGSLLAYYDFIAAF